MVVSRLCDCLRVLRERGRERRSDGGVAFVRLLASFERERERETLGGARVAERVARGPARYGVSEDVCWPPATGCDCESMRCGRADGVSARAALSPDRRVIWETRFDHTPNLHNSDITKFHCLPLGRRLPQQRPSAPRPASQQISPLLPPADGARLRLAGQLARPLARLCRSLPERLAAPVIPGGLEDHPQDDDEEHHHVGRRRRRRRRPRRGRRGRRRPRRAGRRRRRRWRRR